MAMVTVTSPCNTNISQTFSLENNNNNHLHDSSSFSSYLNVAEETFVLTLAKSSPNFNPFVANPNENLLLGGKKIEDGEIGVFDAKKYFNEESQSPNITKEGDMKNPPIEIAPVKTKVQQPRNPSVRSESSWNSQRALLQSSFRNTSRRKPNKAQGKSFFTHLVGCNCSCYDKKSVDIDDIHVGENNSTKSGSTNCGVIQAKTIAKEPIKNGVDSIDSARINDLGLGSTKREDCFSFPVLKCNTRNLAVKVVKLQEEEVKDGKPRNSLEVFGSPVLEKGKKSSTSTHERKSTMLNWDYSTPRLKETEIHSSSNPNGTYNNDTESDASSDLFEIESFTNSGNHFLSRQESDGMSSCVTPTTCYAPSEASIEWSVVTGSIADFSVMSDSEETSSIAKATPNLKKVVPTAKTPHNKEIQKRRTSLLACKSHKAVRVVGEAYRTTEKSINDPRRCNTTDSIAPITRFRAETNMTKFDSRNGRSISRTHSPSASHMLYI